MDHLQNDIDSLEMERGALRDKLKVFSSKKGDLKQTTAFGKSDSYLTAFGSFNGYTDCISTTIFRYHRQFAIHCTGAGVIEKSIQ